MESLNEIDKGIREFKDSQIYQIIEIHKDSIVKIETAPDYETAWNVADYMNMVYNSSASIIFPDGRVENHNIS